MGGLSAENPGLLSCERGGHSCHGNRARWNHKLLNEDDVSAGRRFVYSGEESVTTKQFWMFCFNEFMNYYEVKEQAQATVITMHCFICYNVHHLLENGAVIVHADMEVF